VITYTTWEGSQAALHQHVTGGYLGDEYWLALVASLPVVRRRAYMSAKLVHWLQRHIPKD